ncbi:MAG: L-2-hydroxyglutarate oxidase [Deltaproteobacteria bacterium]|nr:L-2-hydroxyglutarate oxidase [Deltaproteobacteria bacterium]MBI3388762.1 L-2-hydroxyglutarate oxidase [Deltaproteobacteria bacterium]
MAAGADVIVIGGGIVGLSTAMAIGERYPRVQPLVLEKEAEVARHQTGHNSGVIHSGLYYKPGSMKAQMTVAGARRMIEFCQQHNLPHTICGKVVVATEAAEVPRLEELQRRGVANGVEAELIGPERLREIEPHAAGLRALRVPATGIVDYGVVARCYAELILARGGEIRTNAAVTRIVREAGGWVIETAAGTVRTRNLINCAGLHSDRIARLAGFAPPVKIVPFRGEYYALRPERESLVKALIYPVPDPAFPFLGVHFTRMVHGGVEAGPNAVLSLKREGYRKTDFDARDAWESLTFPGFIRLASKYWKTGLGEMYRSFSKGAFVRALQRLLPELRDDDLTPGGSGVRAQALTSNGALVDDFSIQEGDGAIHVLNAPSPAATASLMIGEAIAERAGKSFAW